MELVDIAGCQCWLTVPGQGETPIRRRWLLFRANVSGKASRELGTVCLSA